MIIKDIYIEKFRAINDLTVPLGGKITAIAGQNGTMKTTLLGMIGQPFTISDKKSPLYDARTIEGTQFKAPLSEKFKFSVPDFDKAGEHKWRLNFVDNTIHAKGYYELQSYPRSDTNGIRLWTTEGREKGMGYVQYPVIYLSLKRVLPIGEEENINLEEDNLDDEEKKFYIEYHNRILIMPDEEIKPEYLKSTNKKTLGGKTPKYDSLTISAGQDNIGKILLTIMSFARLKKNYPKEYKGGILLIDELEATLFPGAEVRLIHALSKFAQDLKLQIIFTTHSLRIMETIMQYNNRNDVKLIYLTKEDGNIKCRVDPSYEAIMRNITVTMSDIITPVKITVYCEDNEARMMLKALLPQKIKRHLFFAGESLGCGNLKDLCKRDVKEFSQSIIVLDGGETVPTNKYNFVLLPGKERPENIFYNYLKKTSDNDTRIWDAFEQAGYTKQICFSNYPNGLENRKIAKQWFREQQPYWKRNISRVMKPWKKDNTESVNEFLKNFIKAYNYVAELKGLSSILLD